MKKIKKEKKEYTGEYIPVVRAVIVLIILILILIGLVLYSPTKKEELQEPNTLQTDEMIVNKTGNSCDGEGATRIQNEADKVTVSYEVVDDYFFGYMAEQDIDLNGNGVIDEGEIIEDIGYAIKVKISNLTDKIYVMISNDLDDNVKTFHNTDASEDGKITWTEAETLFSRTYTIKVFSNNEGCTNELYREFKVTLPKYNTDSDSITCVLTEAKNTPACDPFIFSDGNLNEEQKEFDKQVEKVLKEKNKEEDKEEENESVVQSYLDKAIDYLKKNPFILGLGIIVIIILVALAVVTLKKRKKTT